MLHEELSEFRDLTGKDPNLFNISYIGGYLEGYHKAKQHYNERCKRCFNDFMKKRENHHENVI